MSSAADRPPEDGPPPRRRFLDEATLDLSDDLTEPTLADAAAPTTSDGLAAVAVPTDDPLSQPPEIPGYRILDGIGYGGMAEIWLAEKEGTAGVPVRCVLKTVLPAFLEATKYRERILDEGRIVAQLRHPNICSLLDVGQVDDRIYLAMEWVDGLDASDLMRRVRKRRTELPLRHVLYVLRETLQAVHHAHTALGPGGGPLNVVHRDISPGNILVSRDGAVKLTDFGVALGAVTQRIEKQGVLSGKLHYFAPELFTPPRQATVRSDIFSLGVTFYELLTIKPLFARKLGVSELRGAIEAFDVRQLLEEDLTIPDGVEEILLKSLARDPERRYASALEFLEDVNDYAYESGLRLLGVHFADYLVRLLGPRPEGRRSLQTALRDRGNG